MDHRPRKNTCSNLSKTKCTSKRKQVDEKNDGNATTATTNEKEIRISKNELAIVRFFI
jgi:hypothetical protein